MTTLTGVDPFDPTPLHLFEVTLGAGPGPGSQPTYSVLLFGNKTSAGSETVDTLGLPIESEADAIARFGRRSELFRMYRDYIAVDPSATIYAIAVTESAGVAAAADFTFTNNCTGPLTVRFHIEGENYIDTTVDANSTPTQIAAACKATINAWDGGSLMFTADNALGVLTITSSQKGPRYSLHVGADNSHGIRCLLLQSVATTVSKGNVVAGTTEDDGTAAFAAAIPGVEAYQWVVPWHATSAPTATDNQLGEAATNIATQALPSNGRRWTMHFGLVGTQAQQTTVCTASPMNLARATCWWAENNDFLPGRIAARCAAAARLCYVAHPSGLAEGKSMIGFTTDPNRGTVLGIPAPYVSTDRPLASEIKAALNNGGSPVSFRANGTSYIVRHITCRSLNSQGSNDYKAREGHIPWAIDAYVAQVKATYEAQLQPAIAADPVKGAKPIPRTSTPSGITAMIRSIIDDFAGPKPLGIYDGPILAPDKVDAMKAAVLVTKTTGGFTTRQEPVAVEHLIKSANDIRETGQAY